MSGARQIGPEASGPRSSSLVRTAYRLARAFGWTPQQVQAMTFGQVALYLELLDGEGGRS